MSDGSSIAVCQYQIAGSSIAVCHTRQPISTRQLAAPYALSPSQCEIKHKRPHSWRSAAFSAASSLRLWYHQPPKSTRKEPQSQ
eukprot:3884113-Rhodomonas_salina.1